MVIAHNPLKGSAHANNDAAFNHWLFDIWFNMIPARVKDQGHRVIITQPPNLAPGPATNEALQLLLDHADFVAAIVPAPILLTGPFRDRLFAVIHRPAMGNDLVLCVPTSIKKNPKDFLLCDGDQIQGWYLDFLKTPSSPFVSGSA